MIGMTATALRILRFPASFEITYHTVISIITAILTVIAAICVALYSLYPTSAGSFCQYTRMTYVCSKVLSLVTIAVFVAALLANAAGCGSMLLVLTGTLLSSVLFTLFGVIIATKITSLNQFILATVPVEIVGFVPAILHLFGVTPAFCGIYPANTCMDMIAGKGFSLPGFLLTLVLIILLFRTASSCVEKMWQSQGGIRI